MSMDTIKFQVAKMEVVDGETKIGYVPPMVVEAESVLLGIYDYLEIEADGDWIGQIDNHPKLEGSYKARLSDDSGERWFVFEFEKFQPALTLKF